MARRCFCVVILVMLLAGVQISGCGGGSKVTPLVVSTSSLPNGTVGVLYSTLLRASGGTPPYVWSQTSSGSMPPGVTLGSNGNFAGTPTASGTFGPYVFLVTDSAGNKASTASLTIIITASTLTIATTSLPNGIVGTAYSATLSASGGTPPYTWTEASGGDLPPGLSPLTTGGVIAGVPTAAGTYGPYVFTVTDANNATASTGNLSLAITPSASAVCAPSGNEAALASANPYAFLLKGTDGSGNPITIAGSFTPDGKGGIASALTDYNGFSNGPEQLQVNLATSSYSFSSAAQGCLYLSFSGLASVQLGTASQRKPAVATRKPEIAAAPVAKVQFGFYLSGFDGTVYHTGRIIESDNTSGTGTNASGLIHVQTPSAFLLSSLEPNYAFCVDGWTASAPSILRTAIAGTFSNSSGNLSTGYADMDLGGTPSGEMTGGYGTLNSTIDASNGRGTGSYYLATPNGTLTFDFAFYVLNQSDLILIGTDLSQSDSTTPLLAGRALASSASYAAAPLNGYYLLASEGLQTLGINIGNIAEIGTLNATGAGTIPTATIYSNYAGTYASNTYPSNTYAVEAASGRVSILGLTTLPPVIYLTAGSATDDGIVGFLVGTDPQASSGLLVSQSANTPNYNLSSVTGSYASSTQEDVDGLNGSFLGGFSFSGKGSYTLTSQTTGSVTNVPTTGSVSVNADGSGNLDGGKLPLVTNGQVVFAIPNSGDPLLFVLTKGTLP
jgi:large repetitive protein